MIEKLQFLNSNRWATAGSEQRTQLYLDNLTFVTFGVRAFQSRSVSASRTDCCSTAAMSRFRFLIAAWWIVHRCRWLIAGRRSVLVHVATGHGRLLDSKNTRVSTVSALYSTVWKLERNSIRVFLVAIGMLIRMLLIPSFLWVQMKDNDEISADEGNKSRWREWVSRVLSATISRRKKLSLTEKYFVTDNESHINRGNNVSGKVTNDGMRSLRRKLDSINRSVITSAVSTSWAMWK